MEKKVLRGQIKALMADLSPEDFQREGRSAAEHLEGEPFWKEARRVFAFLSMRREIETDFVVDAVLRQGKGLAVPRVCGDDLFFYDATSSLGPWLSGPFGIREPIPTEPPLNLKAIAGPLLILVPGLAFDSSGGRLGRGKGYYDRFIRSLRASRSDVLVVGFCMSVQLVRHVPMETRDEPMDVVCAGPRSIIVSRRGLS